MRFLLRPTAIFGDACVTGMEFARGRPDGAGGVAATGESVHLPADMVLRSVGYRGVQIPGLPFDDEGGVIPNTAGRILRDVRLRCGQERQDETGAQPSRRLRLVRRLHQGRARGHRDLSH